MFNNFKYTQRTLENYAFLESHSISLTYTISHMSSLITSIS